ncbi:hypothetical protein D3C87_2024410 [compost metagenome]
MWHLERTRNHVLVLVLLACGVRAYGGGALSDQRGKLLNDEDAEGRWIAGRQDSVRFRQMRNGHVHP